MSRWRQQASNRGLPAPDAEPLNGISLVWRSHYAAALLEPTEATALANQGFDLVQFGSDETTWDSAFTQLARFLELT